METDAQISVLQILTGDNRKLFPNLSTVVLVKMENPLNKNVRRLEFPHDP
jgi:hypothetical protein